MGGFGRRRVWNVRVRWLGKATCKNCKRKRESDPFQWGQCRSPNETSMPISGFELIADLVGDALREPCGPADGINRNEGNGAFSAVHGDRYRH